jgi:hypothetical protein
MPHNYTVNFKGEKQVAVNTTGYEKLFVIVLLCIPTIGNQLPPYVMLNIKTVPKGNICKDVIVQVQKKWMNDIEVNRRVAWMCMGTSAWCVMKAAVYACNGYISWSSL